MKPVELVLLMRDKTREALIAAGQNVDGLSKDYDELVRVIHNSEAAMQQSGSTLRGISEKAASEGAKIDNAFKKAFEGVSKYGINSKNELLEAIEQQKQAISNLEEQYGKVNSAYINIKMPVSPDDNFIEQRQKAYKLINESKVELEREKATLEKLEKSYRMLTEAQEKLNTERSPEKITTYRTRIAQLTDEMTRMRDSGQKDTETYRELEEELRRVGTAYNEANKERRMLTTGENAWIAGMVSGIGGIAGAFSAAQGVGSLFIKNNEQLAAIQTKLQAAMAITIGLQQVSTTLHQTSAFRIQIVSKVTDLWNKSLKFLNVTMGLSNTLAKGLMMGGIGLLIAGAGYLIAKFQEWRKEQAEINRIQKEFKNIEIDTAKAMAENSVKINQLIKIANDYNKSIEVRKSAVDRLNKIMPDYNGFIDKEEKLTSSADTALKNYLTTLYKVEKAKKLLTKIEEKQNEYDSLGLSGSEQISFWQEMKIGAANIFDTNWGNKLLEKYSKEKSEGWVDSLNKLKEEKKSMEKEFQDLINDKTIFNALFPEDKSNVDKNSESSEKWLKDAQAQADLLIKIANNEAKAELERRQAKLNNEQKLLDIEQEGWDKRQKQIELNYKKELLAIDKHAQELVEKQQEAERLAWDRDGKKGVFTPQTASVLGLSRDQKNELIGQETTLNKTREAENEKLLRELIEQYQTYADRRIEIEEKFNEDLAVLQANNAAGGLDANIAELEKQKNRQLKAVTDEESAELIKVTDLFVRLFSDAATQSVDQVRRVIDETQALYDYLASTKSEDIAAGFGFTAEQLRLFQANAEQMKSILDGINAKKRELADRSPVDAFAHSLKEAKSLFDKGGNDNVKLGVEKIGSATKNILPFVNQLGEDLGAIFGEDVGSLVSGATEALNSVMNVAEGFAKGGIIGGIAAVVGEAAKLFTKAAEAEARHQEALKEIQANRIAMQRQYNLLLLEQNLLLKEATTIFGEKQIEKAANAINVYRAAIKQFNEVLKGVEPDKNIKSFKEFQEKIIKGDLKKQLDAYNQGIGALNTIQIKTGHEKTGLFGWGKGRDLYSSILDVYGKDKLLNPDGSLNIDFTKTILDTQTLSDENRNLLQSLIDLQQQANEAQEALRDYLKETFGVLGSDLMNSIIASIRDSGVDAWKSFGDAGAKVIENLGQQLAYELFFADKFAKLQKDLEAVYDNTSDPKEIARRQLELVSQFYDQIGTDMDAAKAFMEQWQKEAAEKGFNIYQPDAVSQTGRAGAFTTMSQDTGTKLEGLFTSVQNHTANIDDNVTNISGIMHDALDVLTRIAGNTEYCKFLETVSDDIKIIIRDGLRVK